MFLSRWLLGIAAGICAAIAILAVIYGVNKIDDWYEHRVVTLADVAILQSDSGYPNREANINSALDQIEILDREAAKSLTISVAALFLSIATFIPLWRRASRSFGTAKLGAVVAVTAVVFLSGLGLALVMLSAGVIRG